MAKAKKTHDYDLIIAGGGLAGASLACSLRQTDLRIAVVEAFPFDSAAQPSYDERTIALTYSSKLVFDTIGVWDNEVESAACALERIHISNRGHFGITHLDCKHAGTPALGYVVPTRALGKSLNKLMQDADNIDLICPAKVVTAAPGKQSCEVSISDGTEQETENNKTLTAPLFVIADGGRSGLLEQLDFQTTSHQYQQSALLCIVSSDEWHNHQAFERFTSSGPLALLPMNDQRYAVVWTLMPDELETTLRLDDDAFIDALQHAFGWRAGKLSLPTARKSYPLSRNHLEQYTQQRVVVLGNAAHTVHPVAGQGFNLGLRDVAALAELVHSAQQAGQDIGSTSLLESYVKWRKPETQRVSRFTHGMIQIFSNDFAPLAVARNAGLAAIEHLPMMKRVLLRRTMGLAAHQPKLALGKPLQHS